MRRDESSVNLGRRAEARANLQYRIHTVVLQDNDRREMTLDSN